MESVDVLVRMKSEFARHSEHLRNGIPQQNRPLDFRGVILRQCYKGGQRFLTAAKDALFPFSADLHF